MTRQTAVLPHLVLTKKINPNGNAGNQNPVKNMQRERLLPFILVAITLAVIFSVYWVLRDFQKKAQQGPPDLFEMVPADAEIVFHIKKPALFRESFALTGPLGQNIDALLAGGTPTDLINKTDSLAAADPTLAGHRNTAEILLSFHPNGLQPLKDFLLQVSFASKVDSKIIHTFMQEKLLPHFEFVLYSENPQPVYATKDSGNNLPVYYMFKDNQLVASSRAALLQAPSDKPASDQTNIVSQSKFNDLRNAAGRFSDNLYIRTSTLCYLTQNIQNEKFPLILPCEEIAGWQLWDVSYNAGELLFTGYAQNGVHGQKFTETLARQQRNESSITQHIPLLARSITYVGVSQPQSFAPDFRQWLSINEKEEEFLRQRARFEDLSGLHPDSLPNMWNGEIAWVVTPPREELKGYVIMGMEDKDLLLNHPVLQDFIREASPEETSDMLLAASIYRTSLPGFFAAISGGMVKDDFTWFSFSGGYLLASNSLENLKDHINALRFGFNFAKSEEAALMREFMQPGQNLFFYQSLENTRMGNLISETAAENTEESARTGKTQHSFSWQIRSSHNQLAFSNAMLLQKSEYNVSNPLRWETNLDAPIHKGPFKTFNHNGNQVEFILQDQARHLYLINKEGEILWKKEISGPALSDIYQVDIYKNNRYQYVFNTRNYLHLIDRNGNYVRGYPMRLPAPASAGIAVFDYENNKNYRIIFPSENRRIYNYSLSREPVQGWLYKQSEHLIKQPLQHIRLEGKDFLLATDTTGGVQILDRRGLSRLRPNQSITLLPGTRIFAHEPHNGKPHFIVPGPDGIVKQAFTDGSVFQVTPDTLSGNYRFTYASFSGDTEKDLIFLHKGNLKVYSISSRLIFSLPIERGLDGEINILDTDNHHKYIGITDKAEQRLFLVNQEGEIPSPFPLGGDTTFFIEEDDSGNLFLVTGLGSKLRSYHIAFTGNF